MPLEVIAPEIDGRKTCAQCGAEKPVGDFGYDARAISRTNSRCKECVKERVRRYYAGLPLLKTAAQLAREQQDLLRVKSCTKCGEAKSFEEFGKSRYTKSGLAAECKQCHNLRKKAHPRPVSYFRQYAYKIDFPAMWAAQDGKCAICTRAMKQSGTSYESVVVDHDHRCCPNKCRSCGQCVRALICRRCNYALGAIKEDEAYARALIAYIQSYPRNP